MLCFVSVFCSELSDPDGNTTVTVWSSSVTLAIFHMTGFRLDPDVSFIDSFVVVSIFINTKKPRLVARLV